MGAMICARSWSRSQTVTADQAGAMSNGISYNPLPADSILAVFVGIRASVVASPSREQK